LEPNLFRYVWQKSKREQIVVLLVILASIPFYFVSFDVPKRIVNEAIQGRAFREGKTTATLFDLTLPLPDFLGGSYTISKGVELLQVEYLFALSFVFLVLVLINGAFKYVINVEKGVLGERMLRRLRYDLFVQLLRFKPEDIRAVKPAEVAGMIKDEVEPIGGFVGDAFIQPVFLIVQAATAVVFIMLQSVWLGSLAVFIVALQALIIPALRREQLRLGRERQLASRQLAGRIGEIVDVAPALQGHGAVSFMQSDIAGRLGRLFDIRFALYRRKFAVKFLNNLLAQITPFFFYAVGGYFALKGQLDLGQLVAVIAAYRDLPPPIKELIDWDQQRADVIIKYEQVISQFSPAEVLKLDDEKTAAISGPVDQIVINQLLVTDNRGQTLLEPLTLIVPSGACAILVGPPGSGRDVLGRVLGRQITGYSGKVNIGPVELSHLTVRSASHLIGYAGHEIEIIQGTLRENFILSLQRRKPTQLFDKGLDASDRKRIIEAVRSGNSPLRFEADWIDYAAAGIEDKQHMDVAIREILAVLGVESEVYELGLAGPILQKNLHATERQRLEKALIEARIAIAEELKAANLTGLVETFDSLRFNPNATIGENLMFGSTKSERLSHDNFLADPFGRSILQAEGLLAPLVEFGSRIVTNVVEVFAGLPPGHQLFERYAFSKSIDFELMIELSESLAKQDSRSNLSAEMEQQLVAIALGYIEPRHRFNLIDESFKRRILRARISFRTYLPRTYVDDIHFYEATQPIFGATVRDNLLFGRVGYGVAESGARVSKIIKKALTRTGLDGEIYRLGLDAETGNKGRYLPARLRFAVPLVRALIKHPEIYVLDIDALLSTSADPMALIARLRVHCEGKTLFLLLADGHLAENVDLIVNFSDARGTITSREPENTETDMVRHKQTEPAARKHDTGVVS
jgi:putative ABC transport system ATP-binding protein